MFSENIINLTCCIIIEMPAFRVDRGPSVLVGFDLGLDFGLGLGLGLVNCSNAVLIYAHGMTRTHVI